MQKYSGPSIRKETTNTGAIARGVGFVQTSGTTRQLTAKDLKQQASNLAGRRGEKY